jgi:hypothetical protein
MKLLISNSSQNVNNKSPKPYRHSLTRGDNKKNLWTLPYNTLNSLGWKYINEDNILNTDFNQYMKDNFNNVSVILFWRANTLLINQYQNIINNNIKKFIYLDDLHDSPEIKELKNISDNFFHHFDIFSTYAYCLQKFINTETKVNWLPHSFNDIFFVDFNKDPIDKLLVSGNIDKQIYPMRSKVLSLKNHFPIDYLGHPGYQKRKKHDIVGKSFINRLNTYLACFTCCSTEKTPYMLAKFFEIPGSGSLLVAYDHLIKEELKELGFLDMQNYISVNEQNIKSKLEYIFKNREDIDRIRHNGYNLIHSKHMLSHRGSFINRVIKG